MAELMEYLDPDVSEWTKPLSQTEAAGLLVEVLKEDSLPFDVGPALNCSEVNAVIELLRSFGEEEAAQRWRDGHAREDDAGDDHFTEVFSCSLCSKWRDVEERIIGRDDGPGDYCTDCAQRPY